AVFIGTLGVRARGRDVVVGVVMAFGLGLGVLFITLYKGYATQAFAILFGTITGVSRADVALLIAIGLVTLGALAAIYRPLVFATSLSFASYLVARFAIGPRRPELRLVAARGSRPDVPAT